MLVSCSSSPTELEACTSEMETEGNLGKRKRDDSSNTTVLDPLKREKRHQRSESRKKKPRSEVKVTRKTGGHGIDLEEETKQLVPLDADSIARRYQLEILEIAKKRNVIVYLETGCGKTLIAVLLIKALAPRLRDPLNKRIAVFIVPKVLLAVQQLGVIRVHTSLRAEAYYGDKGVDGFSLDDWRKEIETHDVLVMTPQVFLDALNAAKIKLDIVEVLILDECHHAKGKNPYAKIMEEHYRASHYKPKVFGMTASPVSRGVNDIEDCEVKMKELEQMLDAQVCTPKDRLGVESFAPSPNEIGYYYEGAGGDSDSRLSALEELKEKYAVLSVEEYRASNHSGEYKDEKIASKRLKSHISRLCGSILHCVTELGYWCAIMVVARLLKDNASPTTFEYLDCELTNCIIKQQKGFLAEALKFLQSIVGPGETGQELGNNLVTPKVQLLVKVLKAYRDRADLRCIVFVDRVIDTIGLSELVNALSRLGSLSFLRCEFLTGNSGSHVDTSTSKQQSVIVAFREGKVNIIIATDVAEEGLDVQSCNTVIRFDLPKTPISYIQSRGRARRPGSDYVVLLDRRAGQLGELLKMKAKERNMKALSLDREGQAPDPTPCPSNAVLPEFYKVETTGAVVNTSSSVALVHQYCSKLPKDRFYFPRPDFRFSTTEDKQHICTLKLPANALIHEEVGPPRKSAALAKQVVCLKACEKLHKLGGLNDHLRPVTDAEPDSNCVDKGGNQPKGRGITKQKELHATISTKGLEGCWGNSKHGASLYAYIMTITPTFCEGKEFGDFVLLLESELENDAAELVVKLTLKVGQVVNATLTPATKVQLDVNELADAKKFQEVFFNGMFARLVARSPKQDGVSSWKVDYLCLSRDSLDKLWEQSRMYLLLPLAKAPETESTMTKAVQAQINWEYVRKGAHVAKFLAHESEGDEFSSGDIRSLKGENEKQVPTKSSFNASVQLADGLVSLDQILDTAVVTRHTGRIYFVTKLLEGTNALTAFPSNKGQDHVAESSGPVPQKSYGDYFKDKYGETLQYVHQAFLQTKHSHRVRNLLTRAEQLVDLRNVGKKEHRFANIAPELCISTGLPLSIFHTSYLIPSVMHYLEALLKASQLRSTISSAIPDCPAIPLARIVEALTTSRCLEDSSLERLELLGDSFLKYAVSRSLFLVFQSKHEGQLSARRSRTISNSNLYKLAVARQLPAYIRDEVFDPKRWLAPGMRRKFEELCYCDLAELHVPETGAKASADSSCASQHGGLKSFRKVGKSCVDGHRWLCLKTMADVVESLIGAYYLYGGETAALRFMRWVGIDVEYEDCLVDGLQKQASVKPEVIESADLAPLEARLGYTFNNKALLVEAITHASQQDGVGSRCYQRLEFLGDAVLDFAITKQLFTAYPDLAPGQLTDLRSAAVNNGCFARVAVKHNLQHHLRHASRALLSQIEQFVWSISQEGSHAEERVCGWEKESGPKVLGDMVESIAGAIALDTGFDLDKTWNVMEKLLAPLVTPATLTVHPVRELLQLCQTQGFSVHTEVGGHENMFTASVKISAGERTLTASSTTTSRKAARKDVAQKLLRKLQKYRHHKERVSNPEDGPFPSDSGSEENAGEHCLIADSGSSHRHTELLVSLNQELLTMDETLVPVEIRHEEGATNGDEWVSIDKDPHLDGDQAPIMKRKLDFGDSTDSSSGVANKRMKLPAGDHQPVQTHAEISTASAGEELLITSLDSGRPKSVLHELCAKKKWRGPIFAVSKESGPAHLKRFQCSVTVDVPGSGPTVCLGTEMSEKKRAEHSAAFEMLQKLKVGSLYS